MKILHVEDNREDAELVGALLTEEWPDCSIRVADCKAAFLESLGAGEYDVVLSDFSLGSFTGLDALAIVRERLPLTPFIFLSGTIGEDRAIEALKAGAQDYVLKDRMKRLISAIRRAQREGEERKQRKAAEQTTARFAMLLESTPDFIGMASKDGHIFYINRAGLQMAGYPHDQDAGVLRMSDLHPPEAYQTIVAEGIPSAMRDGTWVGQTVLRSRDGRLVPVSQIIIAHPAIEANAGYFSLIMHDLTGHQDAERRIREQADLLNRARDAIIVTDLGGLVTFWNRGAERLTGKEADAIVGRTLDDAFGFVAHAEIDMAEKALAGNDEWRGEFRLNSVTDKLVVLEISASLVRDDLGRPTARLYIGTDVTAKKSLEEQFLRVQRLDSIGMLASGIAHDLNNVLAPIFLAAPMLREHVTNPVDLSMIATLEKSAERGAGLVRQILSFAHGVGGNHQVLQVKHLLKDTASVINQTFPKNIRLEEGATASIWPILGNATQVHQVLLNLCVNARDAMPGGGKLVMKAENCVLDDVSAKAIPGASSGAWVVLHVEDSGSGIPPEALEHIWEPFYTTKAVGKGTGLGLSTVRGIVENHKGFIELKTRAGRGSTFRVFLPAASVGSKEGGTGVPDKLAPRGNGELILIVDDEAQIRDIGAAILSHHGYRVIIAADGTEAVALFAPRGEEISILITDLSMPNLDGASLANVVRRLNPKIKILAMSGLASGGLNTEAARFAGAFLVKPFKADALLRTVHKLLHGEAAEGQAGG
ncbi:MAG TPA: response regulator [Opitutaceae bacterium]|jgi:PAS domain S-box-containing protein